MKWSGSLTGQGCLERRWKIGATVVVDQVVVAQGINGPGLIEDPSANDYTEMVGVTLEAGTYSTTQGTGASSAEVLVRTTYDPFAIYTGRTSGGTTVNTAHAEGTRLQILTNTTASAGGIVVTDADISDTDYSGGLIFALSGQNRGASRVQASQTDTTDLTVSVPFDYALAVGDTFFRTYAPTMQGVELTGDWTQFNTVMTTNQAAPDAGDAVILDVILDINGKLGGTSTAPVCDFEWVSSDHFLNTIA